MAPTRKSRSVNKRFSFPDELSHVKEADNANKMQRKRKLSDKIGPQWNKQELQHFYDAYRKYGRDWKKVASVVRNRTVEMVEALYTMNRAYLSLPEGTASVVGLIAMMTDHYSVMEGSDSEQESNDGGGPSPHKHNRRKAHSVTTQGLDGRFSDFSVSHAAGSNNGCLSLLKKKRSNGTPNRAVGKRTPRFPVKYTYDNDSWEKFSYHDTQRSRMKFRPAADDVAHKVALALAEASHKGGSPQTSHTPSKGKDYVVSSLVRLHERMHSASEMTSAVDVGNEKDEYEGSLGSMEADNGDFHRDRSYHSDKRGAGTLGAQRKGNKPHGKKTDALNVGHSQMDDIKEACSGTEEGKKISGTKRKLGAKFADSAFVCLPSPRKKSKKVLFGGDEHSTFDALQTLANLSLMMPTAIDTELTAPHEEHAILADKAWKSEWLPSNYLKEKSKAPALKKGDHIAARVQVSDTAKLVDVPALEAKETVAKKRRQKSPSSKGSEQQKKSVSKAKLSSQAAAQPHQGYGIRIVDYSSSSTDLKRDCEDSAASSQRTFVMNPVALPTKVKIKRKVDKARLHRNSEELKMTNAFVNSQSDKDMEPSVALGLKFQESIENCLSNYHVRRWCIFEWFYSSIDYPWFAKSEFVEYLYHVGMGHVPRLTRVEWGVIRSSLGKPRRLSQQFLNEEKEKLCYYRESVRNHYTKLHTGAKGGLPTDLAYPLTVGQCVIAIHPRTREVHNGRVLTVDHNRYHIQFDPSELGVEFVMDIDCMASNPSEIMPASVNRHVSVDKVYPSLKQIHSVERFDNGKKEEKSNFSSSQRSQCANGPSYALPSYPLSSSLKQGKHFQDGLTRPNSQIKFSHVEVVDVQQGLITQSSGPAHTQAREADFRALAELSRVLDKKNALVTELKRMNDDVTEDCSLKDVDSFKKQYAAVLVQLDEVFEQVSSALIVLRQRNTYHGSSSLLWQKSLALSNDRTPFIDIDLQDLESHVLKIVETSRIKAQKMVDAAMQEMEDPLKKVDDAMDDTNNFPSVDDPSTPITARELNGSPVPQNQSPLPKAIANEAPDSKTNGVSNECWPHIPSELITNCVSTLLMIQKCSERQFPPSDVAQILDFAVSSLHPSCSVNLPVYTEIQKCMGIIRSQILALVPT